MQRKPDQGLDAASRRLLLWTAVPVALLMVHFASNSTSVSFPANRTGGSTPYTWQDAPVGFVLYGIAAYMVTCCVVLVCRVFVKFVVEEIRLRRRRGRW